MYPVEWFRGFILAWPSGYLSSYFRHGIALTLCRCGALEPYSDYVLAQFRQRCRADMAHSLVPYFQVRPCRLPLFP